MSEPSSEGALTQYEIRQFAAAAESFLERLMPVSHAAFVANERRAP